MFKSNKFKRQEVVEEPAYPAPEPLEEEDIYDEPAPKLLTLKKAVPQKLPQQPLQKEMVTKEVTPQQDEDVWSVQEYPTQTAPIIFNKKTQQAISIHEALVELLNRTEEE